MECEVRPPLSRSEHGLEVVQRASADQFANKVASTFSTAQRVQMVESDSPQQRHRLGEARDRGRARRFGELLEQVVEEHLLVGPAAVGRAPGHRGTLNDVLKADVIQAHRQAEALDDVGGRVEHPGLGLLIRQTGAPGTQRRLRHRGQRRTLH
jgi:hypothetical protein